MSDQGGGNKGGRPQGRRGRPWFRPRGGEAPRSGVGQRGGEGDGGGNGDARRGNAQQGDSGVETVVRTPPPPCPICGKPVTDILSALTERASSQPAHFDCVMASVAEAEKPLERERLVYLGSGVFAVVETDPQNPKKFQIKRKIQYEPREGRPEWRKGLDRVVIRKS